MSEHRQLLRSASLITFFTLISRVFGYFRGLCEAILLGTSLAADAYVIAFRIPNLLRRLVGEGAVSAAFIPVFSQYLTNERKEDAWRLANAVITILTAFLISVVGLGILFSPIIVKALAWGFSITPERFELAVFLNRIMFPYIFFISLAAVCMGILNSFHRFGPPAFAPVLLNVSIIGAFFLSGAFAEPSVALAVGVVVGGAMQVAVQLPAVFKTGFRPQFRWDLKSDGVRRVGRLLIPVTFGQGITQVNVLVDSLFASFMVTGALASLEKADRVMEFVLGGFVIALTTAILPMLSRQAAQARTEDMKTTMNLAMRIALFITFPSMIGLIVLRQEIVHVLFEYGEFTAQSTALTAWALLFFALGLPGFSMLKIVVSAFYASQDTRTPVKIAFLAMLVNIAANVVFFYPLENGGPAFATAIAAWFNSISLLVIFRGRYGRFGLRSFVYSFAKFVIAGIALGVVVYTAINWPGFYIDQPRPQQALALAITIFMAAATYLGTAYVLRSPEISELRDIFRRRAKA